MCGIAGLISTPHVSEASALNAVRRITDLTYTRGPGAESVWAREGVALGHRRLAILDLDARANQPMVSTDGRYTIGFNGEIYTFRELRWELEADGIAFRTTSDTEVLLTLFAREGECMLRRLRGMFAFAIWDTQTRELFLARDPYGIKPLYYPPTKDGLLFASQVMALLASRLVSTQRESAGLAGFCPWGSVPERECCSAMCSHYPPGTGWRCWRSRPRTPCRIWY
jgi:asparagine synthase (glutamine-hydrolysing)